MKLGREALAIVAPCLREEEQREAFQLFVEAALRAIAAYEHDVQHLQRRLAKPGRD